MTFSSPPSNPLPIHTVMGEILDALNESEHLVLEAPPGAGKTTHVPLALKDAPWLGQQLIVMLEPRRMAARAAAQRMAQLLGEEVGQTVGYRIRQERRTSQHSKIIVVTEGILTRWLQSDPSLEGVGMIIFDEFHERNLDSDLGLALTLQSKALFRDEQNPLKLLVMSATLDGERIASYLNNAPIIRSEGRSYPVEVHYQARRSERAQQLDAIATKAIEALHQHEGNVLVFLPGQSEIRKIQQQLQASLPRDFGEQVSVMALYGGLNLQAQQAAIAPPNADSGFTRKVVLATDIAETSLTIEGVTVVIDSGWVRVPSYDPNTGMTRLNTQQITKASSTQRAGRAGRLSAGTCYRMWGEQQQNSMREQALPEIAHADLTPLALQLLQWGVTHPNELAWIDAPPNGAYQQALDLLQQLGAIKTTAGQAHLQLSPHGEAMAGLPTHPRLAHMLVKAKQFGWQSQACTIAALMSERDPLANDQTDFMLRADIIEGIRSCAATHKAWRERVTQQSKTFSKLLQTIQLAEAKTSHAGGHEENSNAPREQRYAVLLAMAFPDRIGKRTQHTQYKLSNGRNAFLTSNDALTQSEWLVVVEAGGQSGQSSDKIYSAIDLHRELFDQHLAELQTSHELVAWDEEKQRVVAERRVRIGKLTVHSEPIPNIDQQHIEQAILGQIRKTGLAIFDLNEHCQQWMARINLAREHDTQTNWPDLQEITLLNTLEEWLSPFIQGISKLEALKKVDIHQALSAQLDWQQQQRLDEIAPTKLTVPSGSHISIDYTQSPPVLAVKLQEMFGCATTPKLCHGKVALCVHLLSPARRPLQITQDLAGFWQSSYHEIKKEMKGRYPKHPWPDNPSAAQATRHTKKKTDKNA